MRSLRLHRPIPASCIRPRATHPNRPSRAGRRAHWHSPKYRCIGSSRERLRSRRQRASHWREREARCAPPACFRPTTGSTPSRSRGRSRGLAWRRQAISLVGFQDPVGATDPEEPGRSVPQRSRRYPFDSNRHSSDVPWASSAPGMLRSRNRATVHRAHLRTTGTCQCYGRCEVVVDRPV